MEIRWAVTAAEDLKRICAWLERDKRKRPAELPRSSMKVAHSLKIFRTGESKAAGCPDAASFLFRPCLRLLFIRRKTLSRKYRVSFTAHRIGRKGSCSKKRSLRGAAKLEAVPRSSGLSSNLVANSSTAAPMKRGEDSKRNLVLFLSPRRPIV